MSDGARATGGETDWIAWHGSYADSRSSLARRLQVVRRRIGETLDAATTPVRILSLCAGDGRDLLPELAERPRLRATATLVELDPQLAASAGQFGTPTHGIEVRRGDAGDVSTYADVLPVDLLLLCGIFGNVSTADIERTVAAVPALLTAGGTVIWTRGWFGDDDLRPTIRRWFTEAGLTEVAYDGPPERFGVGVARLARRDRRHPSVVSGSLFRFVR